MQSATPLITRLKKIGTTIEQRDRELARFVKMCDEQDIPSEIWSVIYNEKKNALILFSPDGMQYKPIPAEGDKFDVYTGFALAVFKNQTGLSYQDINRFFEMFTKRTKTNDPALRFIRKFVEETTGIREENLLSRLASAKEDRSGKHFRIYVPLCLASIEEDDDDECELHGFSPVDPIERLLEAILSV